MVLGNEDDPTLIKLHFACSDLRTLLKTSANIEKSYEKMDEDFEAIQESLKMTSKRVAPLQSLSIANKALDTRINRAISPALRLLDRFKLFESLQRKLLGIASKLLNEKRSRKRLKNLIVYVDCVDELNEAVNLISQECDPAIQKLQEVVEFLSRTKASDHYRTQRLRETLITLKALYETEVDSMRFDGLLDEALLNLQDEYEVLLQKLKHDNLGEETQPADDDDKSEKAVNVLGSDLEIEVLKKISETLAANDCLDICIDMFVKVRYRRAAKALMRLSPDYLKTYTPEEIDEMQWVSLETSITLWIQHFELAVKTVFVSEKNLCQQVLGNIMEGLIWPECFIKTADKIMAVFFRFGEGVSRSNKEPQKLFKLLDMFDSLEKLKPDFSEIFEGEAGVGICTRFRELEKLLVHASNRVFWEFGLQIEGNQGGLPPPQDGTVPKLVRYAVNYLKNLCVESYSAPMMQVLKTEQLWKAGILSNSENDEDLLKDAISNVMEAIQRNIESKKLRYKDKVVAQIFAMNTYWYIYMRTRNTDLGKLLGDTYMKKRYRHVAEESAYLYQKEGWGSLVKLLVLEGNGGSMRGKMEAFIVGFDEMCQRHRSVYKIVSDADLREQIRDATIRLLVPSYTEFLDTYSSSLQQVKSYPSPKAIEGMLRKIFDDGGDLLGGDGKPSLTRRDSGDHASRRMSVDRTRMSVESRRNEFDDNDME